MKIDVIDFFAYYGIKFLSKIKKKEKINIEKIKTILVISNTAIGDTLFATPALRLIKEKYPDKKIIAILNPQISFLFKTNPYIDEIFCVKNKWFDVIKLLFKMKSKKIDIAFLFHANEPQGTPLAFYLGAKYIVKMTNDKNKYNFIHYNEETKKIPGKHLISYRNDQLNCVDIKSNDYRMELFLKEDWIINAKEILLENNINTNKDFVVGFQVGASAINRMWFEKSWEELAKKILKKHKNSKIVLLGSKGDLKLISNNFFSICNDKIVNFVGKTSLGVSAAIIKNIDILIAPDTGPLHMATALDINTIGLFACADHREVKPFSKSSKNLYIQKERVCNPCKVLGCTYQKCMEQISVEEVYEKVLEIKND